MRRARLVATLLAGIAAVALGGCSASSSGNTAYIRTVDAVSDGGTATIYINEGTANGSQTYFQASPYLYIGTGTAAFSFTLTADAATTFSATTLAVTSGNAYSVVAMGRADVTSSEDARRPRLVVLQDDTSRPSGNHAAVRMLNAAPDSTGDDLYINGAGVSSDITYASASSYVSVPAGSISVQVDQTGTTTAVAGPQNFTVSAGKDYTIYFVEPNVMTPTYGVQILSDSP